MKIKQRKLAIAIGIASSVLLASCGGGGDGGGGGVSTSPTTSSKTVAVTSPPAKVYTATASNSIPASTSSYTTSTTATNSSYASTAAQNEAGKIKLNSTAATSAGLFSIFNFADKDRKTLDKHPEGVRTMYFYTGLNRALADAQVMNFNKNNNYVTKIPISVQNTSEKTLGNVFTAPAWNDSTKFTGGGLVVAMIDGKVNLDGTITKFKTDHSVVDDHSVAGISTTTDQAGISDTSLAAADSSVASGSSTASSSPFLIAPTEIYLPEDATAADLNKKLNDSVDGKEAERSEENLQASYHGTKVARIIASKRLDGVNHGFAPGVNLKFAELKGFVNYKTLFDKVSAVKPVVVNNSFHIVTNKGDLDLLEFGDQQVSVKKDTYLKVTSSDNTDSGTHIDVNYKSLYGIINSLKETTKQADAPLYVFASGNVPNLSYLLPNINLKEDSNKSKPTSAASNNDTSAAKDEIKPNADLVKMYYQALSGSAPDLTKIVRSDYGLKIDADSGLTQLLKDKDISDHLLVVTGASGLASYNDIRGASLKKAKELLVADAEKTSTTRGDGTVTSGEKPVVSAAVKSKTFNGNKTDITEVDHPQLKSILSKEKDLDTYYEQYKKVTISPIAIQCGVAKYSCITAINDYAISIPGDTADTKYVVQSIGTSFAAPQVTAIAALVKEQFPWMNAKQLKTTLLTTAIDYGEAGVDEVYGWGMVNAVGALNGPAGFVFGDFEVNLNNRNYSYYFSNDIYGTGGLILNGGNKDYLYLLGDNGYTGKTVVNGGNLVVAPGSNYGTNFKNVARLKSSVYVNPKGKFYATGSELTNLYNSGVAYLDGVALSGNLTNNQGATLVLNSDPTRYSSASSATLNGNLYIVHNNKSANYANQEVEVFVVNGTIYGSLSSVKSESTALVASQARIASKGGKSAVVVKLSPRSAATLSAKLASTNLDSSNLRLGASKIDNLIAAGSLEYSKALAEATSATAEVKVASAVATATDDSTEKSQAGLTLLNELAKSQTSSAGSSDSGLTSSAVAPLETSLASASLESVLAGVDSDPVTLTSTSSSTPLVNSANQELVKAYQALGEKELLAATYALSAPIFADARAADSFHAQQNLRHFAKAVLDFAPEQDQRTWYYFDVSKNNSEFKSKNSVVAGDYSNRDITIGTYWNINQFNLGFALNQGSSTLSENYQALAIGSAEVERVGVVLSGAYHYNQDLALGLALGASKTEFKVKRNPLVTSPISSSFKQVQYALDLQAKYRLWSEGSSRLDLVSGLTFNYLPGFNFAETSKGELIKYLRQSYQAEAKLQATANLGVDYRHDLDLGGVKLQLNAGASIAKAISNPELSLQDSDAEKTASVFSPDLVAKLKAGLTVFLSDQVSVSLSGSYQKASHFSNKDANLTVKFTY